MNRPTPGVLLRMVVSGVLIAYVIARVEWVDTRDLLYRTNLYYLLWSFAIGVALIFVSALKWWVLLKARKRALSLGRLFHLYLVGYFFNNILPSNVGGDLIRGYEAGKELDDKATAIASVFVERFTGLTALIMLAMLSFISNLRLFGDKRFSVALAVAVLGYLFLLAMVASKRPLALISDRMTGTPLGKVASKLKKLQAAINSYSNHKKTLGVAMALSFVFYLLAVVNVYVSSLTFGTHVPVKSLFVIVPVILVISMIPISLGGIGLQEWAYYFTFSAIGVGGSLGLLVAILMRFKAIAYGIAGGGLYMIKGTGREVVAELHTAAKTDAGRSASSRHAP